MISQEHQIYLASKSPRRRDLLAQIGVRFRTLAVEVAEVRRPAEEAEVFVRRMAREKAHAGLARTGGEPLPVLGADTVVVVDGEVLGKPRDRKHALVMLRRLSGRTHQVVSALSLATAERSVERLQVSRVRFTALSEPLMTAYCATGEPLDKAGAYAIQGFAGAFVEYLEGSYSGVMGLPLFETVAALTEVGVLVAPADFMRSLG